MKRKNNNQEVDSDFNRAESFDYNHIPTRFDSVKASSISKIKRSAMEKVANNTHFEPSALEMALKSIDGLFNPAYKTLEGDYTTRLYNLKKAFKNGLKTARMYFRRYEFQIEQHNSAFNRYNQANEIINGSKLSDSLKVDTAEIEKIRNSIEELAKKQ